MWLADWLALAFLVVATLGTLAYTALHGFRTWRAFRTLSRRAAHAAGEVTAAGVALERRAVSLSDGSARLAQATAHLRISLAHLQALKRAADEARPGLLFVRTATPRK